MTLVELLFSIAIGTVVIMIVGYFLVVSVKDLTESNIKTESIDSSFTFRETINRFVKGGYDDFELFGSGSNNTLLLKNNDLTSGVIYGIINNKTKKIEKNYIYGENYIGYRKVSELELNNINTNSGVIYDYIFRDDKIYHSMVVKDFSAKLYDGGDILDLYISVVNLYDNNNYGNGFEDIYIDILDIYEFNLVF